MAKQDSTVSTIVLADVISANERTMGDLVAEWQNVLSSADVVSVIAGHKLAEVDAAAVTVAIGNLEHDVQRIGFGQAVGIYTVRQAFPAITQQQLADASGISKGRVSQLEGQGQAFVQLQLTDAADPTQAAAATAVRKLTTGKGAQQMRDVLGSKRKTENKRSAIVALATPPKAVTGTRGPNSAGGRKVEGVPDARTPETVESGPALPTDDASIAARGVALVQEAAGCLSADRVGTLSPRVRKNLNAALASILAACKAHDATSAQATKEAAAKAS